MPAPWENEEDDFELLRRMETEFERKNPAYMAEILERNASLAIRVHAVCILAEIGGEESVAVLTKVLRVDASPLVRHEAAFSLGQLCYRAAVPALIESLREDPSFLVRHESAVALGSIGDERARQALKDALNDGDEDVRNSARIALFYLDYLRHKDGSRIVNEQGIAL